MESRLNPRQQELLEVIAKGLRDLLEIPQTEVLTVESLSKFIDQQNFANVINYEFTEQYVKQEDGKYTIYINTFRKDEVLYKLTTLFCSIFIRDEDVKEQKDYVLRLMSLTFLMPKELFSKAFVKYSRTNGDADIESMAEYFSVSDGDIIKRGKMLGYWY